MSVNRYMLDANNKLTGQFTDTLDLRPRDCRPHGEINSYNYRKSVDYTITDPLNTPDILIERIPTIRKLYLPADETYYHYATICHLHNLEEIHIERVDGFGDTLYWLELIDLPLLKKVYLEGDLKWLRIVNAPALTEIDLRRTENIDLVYVSGVPELTKVNVNGCRKLKSIQGICAETQEQLGITAQIAITQSQSRRDGVLYDQMTATDIDHAFACLIDEAKNAYEDGILAEIYFDDYYGYRLLEPLEAIYTGGTGETYPYAYQDSDYEQGERTPEACLETAKDRLNGFLYMDLDILPEEKTFSSVHSDRIRLSKLTWRWTKGEKEEWLTHGSHFSLLDSAVGESKTVAQRNILRLFAPSLMLEVEKQAEPWAGIFIDIEYGFDSGDDINWSKELSGTKSDTEKLNVIRDRRLSTLAARPSDSWNAFLEESKDSRKKVRFSNWGRLKEVTKATKQVRDIWSRSSLPEQSIVATNGVPCLALDCFTKFSFMTLLMREYPPLILLNMLLDTIHYFIGEMPVFVIAWSENRLHVHNKIWDEARYRIAALGSEEYKAYKKAANTLRESLSLEKRCLIDPLFSDYSDWIKQDVADCLAAKELPETANWLLLALKDQKRLATKLLHRMIVQGQFGDKKNDYQFLVAAIGKYAVPPLAELAEKKPAMAIQALLPAYSPDLARFLEGLSPSGKTGIKAIQNWKDRHG